VGDATFINPILNPNNYGGGSKLTGTIQGTDTAEFYNQRYIWTAGASLSKPNGDLLAYTNGYTLMDATGHVVPGGDTLAPSPWAISEIQYGSRMDQCVLLLPKPGDSSEFRVITTALHVNGSLEDAAPRYFWMSRFKVHPNGYITCIEKNRVLVGSQFMEPGTFNACRHGNGRDWWVFAKCRNSINYHRFLFTPDTVMHDSIQVQGSPLYFQGAQLVFSPNGQYAAAWDNSTELRIFDFDRCQGTFTLLSSIQVPTAGAGIGATSCFTLSSSYLYLSLSFKIYRIPMQSNLQANDLQLVRTWTLFADSTGPGQYPNNYWGMEPSLNGTIFISGTGSCHYYCTITNPDAPSVANVGYGHFNFKIPHFNNATTNNIPYHGLGAKVGSPCDTLSAITDVGKSGVGLLRLYPNPGAGQGTVLYDAVYGGGLLQVCSATGQEVHRQTLYPGSQQAEVQPKDALAPGVYSITLQAPQGGPSNRIKWVVTQP
jgi:hypothetical protein